MRPVLWVLLWTQIAGCSYFYTMKGQYAGTRRMLVRGDFQSALQQIEAAKHTAYRHKDRVLFYLDAGMLHHYAGNYQKSNQYLTEAERGIEENFALSVSQAAASLMLNDNALAYPGEDHEDVYLNIFKALNYLHLNQFEDAFVEVRRADDKIKAIENKYGELAATLNASTKGYPRGRPGRTQFRDSALDRWLSMLMYRTEGRTDEAEVDRRRILALWKSQRRVYSFQRPQLGAFIRDAPAGKVKLNLICFTGRGPEKKASSIYVRTEKNTLVIAATHEKSGVREHPQLLQPIYWPGIDRGVHFKLQIPVLKSSSSHVVSIQVSVDGRQTETLQRIESLGRVAEESWRTKLPIVAMKSITRATLKAVAAHAAKSSMTGKKRDRNASVIAGLLLDLALSATENADLRISRFFPAEAFVGQVEVGLGEHQIDFVYRDGHGRMLAKDQQQVHVSSDRLNLVESVHLN